MHTYIAMYCKHALFSSHHLKAKRMIWNFHLFVVYFVWHQTFIPLKNFSLKWRCSIIGEGLQILSYTRHSWPLSSESAIPTVTPFIMDISEDLWHSHLVPKFLAVDSSFHIMFLRLVCRSWDSNSSNLLHARRML